MVHVLSTGSGTAWEAAVFWSLKSVNNADSAHQLTSSWKVHTNMLSASGSEWEQIISTIRSRFSAFIFPRVQFHLLCIQWPINDGNKVWWTRKRFYIWLADCHGHGFASVLEEIVELVLCKNEGNLCYVLNACKISRKLLNLQIFDQQVFWE